MTQRGKNWEILNSWWIILTLGIVFLNWIAFLYIGITAKKVRWMLWSVLYFVPLVITVAGVGIGTSTAGLVFLLDIVTGVMGIIHGLKVRKEYLIRLDIIQKNKLKKDRVAELRKQAEEELNGSESATTVDGEVIQERKRVRAIDYMFNRTDNAIEAIDSAHAELDKINRSIFRGVTAGIVIGTFTLIAVIVSSVSELYLGVGVTALIDVVIAYALAFGIYMRSRVCAILLAIDYIISRVIFIMDSRMTTYIISSLVMTIIVCFLIYEGIRGTFAYHRFINNHKENEKVE